MPKQGKAKRDGVINPHNQWILNTENVMLSKRYESTEQRINNYKHNDNNDYYELKSEKGRDLTQFYDKSPYTNRKIPKASENEDIWLSPMSKAPTPTEKSKKQRESTKTPPKTSITQRLRTDFGRSVRVTIATQLVWLTGLRDPNLPTYHKSRVIKRTHI